MLGICTLKLLLQLRCLFLLPKQRIQDDKVRDSVCRLGVDLDGLL